MVGFIVKIQKELINSAVEVFGDMTHITVHSIKDNQVILLLDTDDLNVLSQKVKEIQAMDCVLGVYPIFSKSLFFENFD